MVPGLYAFDYEQVDLYFLVARKHPPTGWCLTVVFSLTYINAALNDALTVCYGPTTLITHYKTPACVIRRYI